jgi:hypothetical protein
VGEEGEAQKDSYDTKPRTYELTARLSTAEKSALETLQEAHSWQPLLEDSILLDYVWIESVGARYTSEECYEAPWLTTIGLVSSHN